MTGGGRGAPRGVLGGWVGGWAFGADGWSPWLAGGPLSALKGEAGRLV